MVHITIEQKTVEALRLVRSGMKPDRAWVDMLEHFYPLEKLKDQIQHSCPKWAFCILCHRGHIKGVRPGACPDSESKAEAAPTLKALGLLIANPSLADNKRELQRRAFGERTPEGEIGILLALWRLREIVVRAEPNITTQFQSAP